MVDPQTSSIQKHTCGEYDVYTDPQTTFIQKHTCDGYDVYIDEHNFNGFYGSVWKGMKYLGATSYFSSKTDALAACKDIIDGDKPKEK